MDTPHQLVEEFSPLGILAFTTTREAGTFSLASDDPVGEVMSRWSKLLKDLSGSAKSIVISPQVHETTVLSHTLGGEGILRTLRPADGHATQDRHLALAVTIADCVPVFLAHPSGAIAILHSGWRGTVGKIIHQGVRTLAQAGLAPDELYLHLGPSICGRCYEVSADVRSQLTGQPAIRSGHVDLRTLIAEDAKAAGIQHISISPDCTRCDNTRYFSHRAGDTGRQLAVITLG